MEQIFNKLTQIYFSATGTTKRIITTISKEIEINKTQKINLTDKKRRNNFDYRADQDEILIIGMPVYGHQIPEFIVPDLEQLDGSGQPVILVSVYGNISEGISLEQMRDLLEEKFTIISAGTFIGEHSYSREDFKIGHNRPDKKDLEIARKFGRKINHRIKNSNFQSIPKFKSQKVEKYLTELDSKTGLGKRLIKKAIQKPIVDKNKCKFCNICVEKCPENAISTETLKINDNKCIRCMGCVKYCPEEARRIEYKLPFLVKNFLKLNRGNYRDEPKLYI